jgi:hypothetical protein
MPPAARPADSGKVFTHDGTVIMSPENQDKASELSMDFELVDSSAARSRSRNARGRYYGRDAGNPEFSLDLPSDTAAPAPVKFDDIDLTLEDPNKTLVMPAGEGRYEGRSLV